MKNLLVFASSLLIAYFSFSQNIQITKDDTLATVPLSNIRNAVLKFEELARVNRKVELLEKQIQQKQIQITKRDSLINELFKMGRSDELIIENFQVLIEKDTEIIKGQKATIRRKDRLIKYGIPLVFIIGLII